ncbi:hypothetical protein, partial [Klebsiella pneumoniae]|uniref:hypothetical protein n=1 Tax=Klebsiella pneumoniae TaxID=573 RepID=UPI001D0F348D
TNDFAENGFFRHDVLHTKVLIKNFSGLSMRQGIVKLNKKHRTVKRTGASSLVKGFFCCIGHKTRFPTSIQ